MADEIAISRTHRRETGSAALRRRALLVLLAALALVSAFAFGGCKYSDVLTEHVEDPVNGVVDDSIDPILVQNPEVSKLDPIVSAVVAPSERVDEQKQEDPQYDEDDPEEDTTDQREYDPDTSDDANSTSGTNPADAEKTNDDSGKGDDTNDSTSGDSDDAEGDGTDDEPQQDQGEGANEGPAGGGRGGTGTVYDSTGDVTELPEAGSVAAVGQYATIVQMLAGKGGLRATSSAWVADVKAKGVFPDADKEGIDDIAIAWSGDAKTGYALDVDALVKAGPDVVLVDNVDVVLSEDEQARLQEAKIDVLTVPSLGSPAVADEDVVAAVAIVGQILSTASTYYDTSAQVTNYNNVHDETIKNCLDANSGYSYKTIGSSSYPGIYQGDSLTGQDTTYLSATRYTTAFVDSMATNLNSSPIADRRYSEGTLSYLDGETVDASNGIGLSVSGASAEFVLMDYYMQVSGVVNNSYDGVKPSLSGEGTGSPTIILPGYAQNLIPASLAGSYSSRNNYSALWYEAASSMWLTVGDASFPGVLARSDSIAKSIYRSASKKKGIYNVGQPYFVRVVPTGVAGSWADGTVESFLAAPWTFGVFQQNDVAAACDSYADLFYSVFYRVDDASAVIENYDLAYVSEQ